MNEKLVIKKGSPRSGTYFGEMKGADFSPCHKYRYSLWRIWDPKRPRVVFIGLNPSTADEDQDDPTIRRCINYAKEWGFGGMYMLNIFGLRATDPKQMKGAKDPIGSENDGYIIDETERPGIGLVVCAWGVHGSHVLRGAQVANMLEERGHKLFCLGTTKDGHPMHPLYLKKDLKPVRMGTGQVITNRGPGGE